MTTSNGRGLGSDPQSRIFFHRRICGYFRRVIGAGGRLKRNLPKSLPLRLARLRWLLLDPRVESSWPRRLKYQGWPDRWVLCLILWRQGSSDIPLLPLLLPPRRRTPGKAEEDPHQVFDEISEQLPDLLLDDAREHFRQVGMAAVSRRGQAWWDAHKHLLWNDILAANAQVGLGLGPNERMPALRDVDKPRVVRGKGQGS